ncbi:hypothetical protein SDC9_115670 [bioreactor metagenome]|uniref:Uncharacterized protein n=1 Tax=bioreactor metagenome TaxID=1076179 RepID=A0A645BTP0_9ZZZZ
MDVVDARDPTPEFLAGWPGRPGVLDEVGELLSCPLVLARGDEFGGHRVAELVQQLDVERGVDQPVLRQRPGRPVVRGVLLQQVHPAELFGHRPQ